MDYSNTQEDNCSNADSGQTGTKTCQMKSPENKPGKLHDLELKDKLAINCDKSDKDNGSKRGEFDDLELQEKSSAGGTDDSTGSNNTEIHVLELQGKEKPDESGVGTRIKGKELYIDTNKILSIIGNDDESGSKGTERLDLELQEKPTTGGSDDSAESKKRELRTIQLRLAAICMVWVFAFTAYSGLQNLESSLNARVGTCALAGLTGGGFLTCLPAPAVISKIGCKGAVCVSVCVCVFVGSMYELAYITCELGVDWVGYAMLCFGICDTVASPVAGILGKYVKRIPLLFGATCLNSATLICMLLWQPKSSEKYIFFLLPAVWGITDGIWQTQGGALIGSIFRDQQEASFANLRMFQALGFTIAYLYSGHLCVAVKLYIALVMVVLSFCLVVVVEMRVRKKKTFKYGQM
ncbi:uncharacterized protein [Littorina saxatilis]|uniref:uncharacterized protein n=1 Tax=Littorina saxatilis TaxID=31220 RepID=UPI0038B5DFEC